MPYISCIVASCNTQRNNHTRKNEVVKCFSFPKDQVLREKWLGLCQVKNFDPVKDAYRKVCIRHFKEEDFVDGLKARLLKLQPKRLKKDALPSLCLTYEAEEEDRLKKIDIKNQVEMLHKLIGGPEKPPEIKKTTNEVKNGRSSKEYLSKLIPIAPKGGLIDVIEHKKEPTTIEPQDKQQIKKKFFEDQAEIIKKSMLKPIKKQVISEHHVKVLVHDNAIYKKRIKDLIGDTTELKQRVKDLESKIQNDEFDFMTKVKKEFSHIFTPNQVDLMLHKKAKSWWSADEYTKAYTLQCLSEKAYIYVKETLNYPLPAFNTLQAWVRRLRSDVPRNKMASPILKTVRQKLLQIDEQFSEFEDRNDLLNETIPLTGIISDVKEDTSENEDIVVKEEIDTDLNDETETNIKAEDENYERTSYIDNEYLIENINEYTTSDNSVNNYDIRSSDAECADEFNKCSDEIIKSDEIYCKIDDQLKEEGADYFEELIIERISDNESDMVDCEDKSSIIEEDNG